MYKKSPKNKGPWKPSKDQCLWCFGKGHMYRVCPEKKKGHPSRVRPDGTRFEDYTRKNKETAASFATKCLHYHAEHGKEAKDREWLVDSGCNWHMMPHKEVFRWPIGDE